MSPWKRGAGVPKGRVEDPYGNSAAVTVGLGGCHLIKPCLLYMMPSQIPPLSTSRQTPPSTMGLNRCVSIPGGASAPAAASQLQEKRRFGWGRRGRRWCCGVSPGAAAPALFPVGVGGFSSPGRAVPQWARGTDPAWEDAPWPGSPSSY